MANKNLFISRYITESSPFHKLKKFGFNIIGQSLLEFSPIPFKIAETDWIFFYSKNGISQFFKKEKYNFKLKYGVIGASSADFFFKTTTHKVQYTGSNNGKEIAQYFNTFKKDTRITFIKAKNSLGSVEKHLDVNLDIISLTVYDNKFIAKIDLPYCEIVALTSPMNAIAWFDSQALKQDQKFFAIGGTTAQKINELKGTVVAYPKSPSELSLYNLIKNELENNIDNIIL